MGRREAHELEVLRDILPVINEDSFEMIWDIKTDGGSAMEALFALGLVVARRPLLGSGRGLV